MRRKYFGLAIAALATLGSTQAWGGDREIAQTIIQRLKTNRDSGALKNFNLDMKVDKGTVLLRGSVAAQDQKDLVLSAAQGIDGIVNVVDELSVQQAVSAPAIEPAPAVESVIAKVAKPAAKTLAVQAPAPAMKAPTRPVETPVKAAPIEADSASFAEALASEAAIVQQQLAQVAARTPVVQAPVVEPATQVAPEVTSNFIQPAAAFEEGDVDKEIVSSVVQLLGDAKNRGQLKGFGVDVKCDHGILHLKGRAASVQQRALIVDLASQVSGISQVRESIVVPAAAPQLAQAEPIGPRPARPVRSIPAQVASARLPHHAPIVDPAPLGPAPAPPQQFPPTQPLAAAPAHVPASTPIPHHPQQLQALPVQYSHAAPAQGFAGQPVPVGAYGQGGAPLYDSPNLPNYAWPGYAAQSNYAALTYPQQYSPTAWPFIGPFYPYPQVPLGWRKVSLEWDDGWWFLDFTDK